jgi:hypothetical protein
LLAIKLALLYRRAGSRFLVLSQRLITALWLFNLLRDPLWLLARLPRGLYVPIGPLAWLPSSFDGDLLSVSGLLLLQSLTIAALLFCFWPRFFTAASILSAMGVTVICSLDRSFGVMVRQDIVALLALYALAGCSLAAGLNERLGIKSKNASRVPVVMIPALLCFTYFLAGTSRAIIGGVAFFTGPSSQLWILSSALSGRYYNVSWGLSFPGHPFLMACTPLVVLFATGVEISAPLCLVFPLYRWFFVPFMAVFHVLTLFIMNIFFINNIMLLFWLIDWPEYFPSLRTPAPAAHQEAR